MNKPCARCEKTVYPIEELKCLDKIWHKGCFKCQECGMTLNMKTYKGYGKLPYCESHVPKAKHTTMAETPELKRIAENTKIQSNVKYHADFEKSKGKFTQVADDPETLRIKANTRIISNVAYHGDLAKKAAMEKQRTINENGELVELPTPDNYQIQIESYATELLAPSVPHNSNSVSYGNTNQNSHHNSASTNASQSHYNNRESSVNSAYSQPKYESDYGASQYSNYQQQPPPSYQHAPNVQISSYRDTQAASQNLIYDESAYDQTSQSYVQPQQGYQQQSQGYHHQQQANYAQRIGKIADYDPLTDGPRSTPYTQRPTATLIYNSSEQPSQHPQQQQQHMHGQNNGRAVSQHHISQTSNRRIGSVADMDPLNDVYGSLAGAPQPVQPHQIYQSQQQRPQSGGQTRGPQAGGNSKQGTGLSGRVYVAMYDYEATDTDEVSFREGDLISNVSSIDEGWMTGQVLRTGQTGMLPANYVELAPI